MGGPEPVVHLHPIQGKDRMVEKGYQFCIVGLSLGVEPDEKDIERLIYKYLDLLDM